MARVTKVLTAINDVLGPILISDEESQYVSVFMGAGALGTVVLEFSGQDDGANPAVDEWIAAPLTPAGGGATVASLVGAAGAQYGYALLPGGHKFRVRKSVAGPGNARCTLATSCV